jgi:hypothetical protein
MVIQGAIGTARAALDCVGQPVGRCLKMWGRLAMASLVP